MLHAQMPGSNPWFQALSRCEEHLFLLPDAEFNLVTQTSTFTELLDLTEWIHKVCPECPADRGWLMTTLWQYGHLRLQLAGTIPERWHAYQQAQLHYREVVGHWDDLRRDTEAAPLQVRRALVSVMFARYCTKRLADSLGVTRAKEERHVSVYEMSAEFRRFGGGGRRRR